MSKVSVAEPLSVDLKPNSLLDVQGLSVRFHLGGMVLGAVNEVDFQLALGETLCLLGESGVV